MENKWMDIFPFNLSFDLFGDWTVAKRIHIDNLISAIDSLEERESKVLRLRYEENLTVKEVGERIGLSPSRAREILYKAQRNLKHPEIQMNFRVVPEIELIKAENNSGIFAYRIVRLERAFQELSEGDTSLETIHRVSDYRDLMELSVEKLPIPRRTITSLKRNRLDTIRDLKNCTFSELKKVSNIGAKSAQEVVDALKELGIEIKE